MECCICGKKYQRADAFHKHEAKCITERKLEVLPTLFPDDVGILKGDLSG